MLFSPATAAMEGARGEGMGGPVAADLRRDIAAAHERRVSERRGEGVGGPSRSRAATPCQGQDPGQGGTT